MGVLFSFLITRLLIAVSVIVYFSLISHFFSINYFSHSNYYYSDYYASDYFVYESQLCKIVSHNIKQPTVCKSGDCVPWSITFHNSTINHIDSFYSFTAHSNNITHVEFILSKRFPIGSFINCYNILNGRGTGK